MSARDNILRRIRSRQGREGSEPTAAELDRVRARIALRAPGPQPSIARPADSAGRFRAECDRLGTTWSQVEGLAEVPAAVARYLEANGLSRRITAWRELASLDWNAARIEIDDRAAQESDATGLTGGFCAIAETGTVLILGSPATPKATALLPETHICVVRLSRLVDTMEQAFALLRSELGELPRATWFVSGPSRTADIEQTLVIGAHGPYRVHVILSP